MKRIMILLCLVSQQFFAMDFAAFLKTMVPSKASRSKVSINQNHQSILARQPYTPGEEVLVTLEGVEKRGTIESIVSSKKDRQTQEKFVYAVRLVGQKPDEKCHMCTPDQLAKLELSKAA
jgi:hypothetical protein